MFGAAPGRTPLRVLDHNVLSNRWVNRCCQNANLNDAMTAAGNYFAGMEGQ